MRKIILLIILTFSFNIFSKGVDVKVKGMVCSFCSTGVEKTFNAQKEVKKVHVDMDKKLVTIDFKDGNELSNEKITKLIEDSGFNVAEIKQRN